MISVELRDYQRDTIELVRARMRSGARRVMLTIPTGGGKTLTAAAIVAGALAKGRRALFVAHRLELIDQTVATFARIGICSVGVIRAGDKRRDASQPIQVASIQTLARREQTDVDLVIVDEAHRAVASSYAKHVFARHERAAIIGLSATPCRADGRPLGTCFDDLVIGASYSGLIRAQHIVAPIVYSTPVLPDMSSIRTSGGDYNQDDLENAMNRGALIGDIVEQWARHPRQRTVVFGVSVAHSLAIVERFRASNVRAEHLDGTTPEDERRAMLGRLASGDTELIGNVGVLCEGWDMPACKTLILARPTKSLTLYMQMAGRILRPWNDITPLVLDHGGNVDRHGLPHEDREWSLSGKAKKATASNVKACPACFAFVAGGFKSCPHCGHAFASADGGAQSEREEREPLPVDLALRTLDGDDARLAFFRTVHKQARQRGYKLGWAIHRFSERFGEPPAHAWIAALKSDHRTDRDWKDKIKSRQTETSQ